MTLSANIRRPHQAGLNLLELLFALAALTMLAMVAVPIFTDYVVRARLSDDISRVSGVKLQVLEYHLLTGRLPESNTELGLPADMAAPGDYLNMFYIDTDPVPGTIKLVFDGSGKLPALGENNELWFEPEEINDSIIWDCTGGSLEFKYRPGNCRIGDG